MYTHLLRICICIFNTCILHTKLMLFTILSIYCLKFRNTYDFCLSLFSTCVFHKPIHFGYIPIPFCYILNNIDIMCTNINVIVTTINIELN